MNVNHYFPNITVEEYQLLQLHNGETCTLIKNEVTAEA